MIVIFKHIQKLKENINIRLQEKIEIKIQMEQQEVDMLGIR